MILVVRAVAVTDTAAAPTSGFSGNPDLRLDGAEQLNRPRRVPDDRAQGLAAQGLGDKVMGAAKGRAAMRLFGLMNQLRAPRDAAQTA